MAEAVLNSDYEQGVCGKKGWVQTLARPLVNGVTLLELFNPSSFGFLLKNVEMVLSFHHGCEDEMKSLGTEPNTKSVG